MYVYFTIAVRLALFDLALESPKFSPITMRYFIIDGSRTGHNCWRTQVQRDMYNMYRRIVQAMVNICCLSTTDWICMYFVNYYISESRTRVKTCQLLVLTPTNQIAMHPSFLVIIFTILFYISVKHLHVSVTLFTLCPSVLTKSKITGFYYPYVNWSC